jgi:hypothetical protein
MPPTQQVQDLFKPLLGHFAWNVRGGVGSISHWNSARRTSSSGSPSSPALQRQREFGGFFGVGTSLS